jgi:putative FmdB family regulatory protein
VRFKERFMPIFEYRCNKCGKEFEELVSSADSDAECPECCSPDVEKLISGFSSLGGSGGGGGGCSHSAGGG